MQKGKLLYEGKAKRVYAAEGCGDHCVMEYKNTATAFNGEKKEEFEGKGRLNCSISAAVFEYLEKNGVKSHFVRKLSDTAQLCKKVEIVPLEVIVRNVAAGSFSKRFGVPEGTELRAPSFEFSYKDDSLGDPMINNSQILAIGIATEKEISIILKSAAVINKLLKKYFAKANLRLIDFKLEFGRCEGEIILADEISPDTCRLWDKKTSQKLDKDRFRRDLGGVTEAYIEVNDRLSKIK